MSALRRRGCLFAQRLSSLNAPADMKFSTLDICQFGQMEEPSILVDDRISAFIQPASNDASGLEFTYSFVVVVERCASATSAAGAIRGYKNCVIGRARVGYVDRYDPEYGLH